MFTACSPVCMTHPKIDIVDHRGVDRLRDWSPRGAHARRGGPDARREDRRCAGCRAPSGSAPLRRSRRQSWFTCSLFGAPTLAAGAGVSRRSGRRLSSTGRGAERVERIRRPALGWRRASTASAVAHRESNALSTSTSPAPGGSRKRRPQRPPPSRARQPRGGVVGLLLPRGRGQKGEEGLDVRRVEVVDR